jgi:hypothetical protein
MTPSASLVVRYWLIFAPSESHRHGAPQRCPVARCRTQDSCEARVQWCHHAAEHRGIFVLAALSLWLLFPESVHTCRLNPQHRGVVLASVAVVALVVLLTLGEYRFHLDLGIDALLFHKALARTQIKIWLHKTDTRDVEIVP